MVERHDEDIETQGDGEVFSDSVCRDKQEDENPPPRRGWFTSVMVTAAVANLILQSITLSQLFET